MNPRFEPASKQHPQEAVVPRIRFLGEQNGPSESLLKGKLIQFFERDRCVNRAWLARIDFGSGTQMGVALCLRCQYGADRGLAEKVGWIFASLFGPQEHMDVVFLETPQEADLMNVCRPFFQKPPKRNE